MRRTKGSRLWTGSFIAICICCFCIYFNFYILVTALPLFVKDTMHGSQQQMGLVITLWSAGVISLRLFSGRWMDRFGMKTLSIVSLAVYLAATAMYGGVSSIGWLLAIRVLHGGSFGLAATSTSALAAELASDSRKGEGIGYFGMFMSVAMVIGPACGIFLWDRHHNEAVLFGVSSVVSCLALICIFRIKYSDRLAAPAAPISRKAKRLSWRHLIERRAIPVSLVGFVLSFSYSSLTSFISPYTVELHQSGSTGLFFVVFAVMMIATRPFVGRAIDRYDAGFMIYPGVVIFSLGMFLLSREGTAFELLLAAAFLGLGHGALFPCLQTLAFRSASEERRGVATSTFFLLFDIGVGIGSFLLGWIAEAADYRFMYLIASVVVLLCIVLYHFSRRSD